MGRTEPGSVRVVATPILADCGRAAYTRDPRPRGRRAGAPDPSVTRTVASPSPPASPGRSDDPTFLVLLPVLRPPHLLPFAVQSVLHQTRQDFELHIVCDGAPDETARAARDLARRHRRVAAHVFPKGERNGEAYRDPIIRESRARVVCQIADDDLWFPDHLAEIGRLLDGVGFGHTIQTEAAPGGVMRPRLGDISDPRTARRMIQERFNLFGPTASGYRREAYLKLPEGWTPAPPDVWSDLHMWRKFLRHEGIRCGTRFSFTNLHIAAPRHQGMTIEDREAINRAWWDRVANPDALDRIIQSLLRHALAGSRHP